MPTRSIFLNTIEPLLEDTPHPNPKYKSLTRRLPLYNGPFLLVPMVFTVGRSHCNTLGQKQALMHTHPLGNLVTFIHHRIADTSVTQLLFDIGKIAALFVA